MNVSSTISTSESDDMDRTYMVTPTTTAGPAKSQAVPERRRKKSPAAIGLLFYFNGKFNIIIVSRVDPNEMSKRKTETGGKSRLPFWVHHCT